MKFVDIKNDVAFRKIFGNENKTEVIISFINATLDLPEGRRITSVEINNTFQLPPIIGLKASIVDVRVTDQNDSSYIVEMQVEEKQGFDKRLQYYTAKRYVSQISTGEQYPELKPVIFIAILDYNLTTSKDYTSRHLILDKKTNEHCLKDFEYNFVELKKFNKNLEDITELSDKWIYFLKHSDKLDEIPEHVKDEGLTAAYKSANTHSWSKEELLDYDYAAMRKQDERGKYTIHYERGEKAGIEKGMEKGIEKGIEKEKKNSEKLIKKAEEEKQKAEKNNNIIKLYYKDKKTIEEISTITSKSIAFIKKVLN